MYSNIKAYQKYLAIWVHLPDHITYKHMEKWWGKKLMIKFLGNEL